MKSPQPWRQLNRRELPNESSTAPETPMCACVRFRPLAHLVNTAGRAPCTFPRYNRYIRKGFAAARSMLARDAHDFMTRTALRSLAIAIAAGVGGLLIHLAVSNGLKPVWLGRMATLPVAILF